MTATSAKINQTLETWHREIPQREIRWFLTHRALAPPQLESLVLCFVYRGKMKSSSVGVRGTGAGQPPPAPLLTMEHKSQIHCHWETETGLSGKKTNALKCPLEAEAALWIPQTVRGTGQRAQWHSHRGCWCGELWDQPAAQVRAQVTVPAEFHMVMSLTLSLNPSSHLYTMKILASLSHTGTTTSALRNPGGLGTRM